MVVDDEDHKGQNCTKKGTRTELKERSRDRSEQQVGLVPCER